MLIQKGGNGEAEDAEGSLPDPADVWAALEQVYSHVFMLG